jgi:cytochrome b subunit of formate dehydrogenase
VSTIDATLRRDHQEAPAPLAEEAVPFRLEYRRFGAFHRWMHFLTMVSFTVLVFTGMPLKYKTTGWAKFSMDLIGGVQTAAILHRLAALVTVFYFVCEALFIILYIVRRRGPLWGPGTITPGRKDWEDMKGMFRWFLGRGPHPRFDRFTYWEKFDFWSLAVGTVIIGATGFMMWFPVQTTKVLPGFVLNWALAIHSSEALLAVGVIFLFVHFFSAHLKPGTFPMDKVIFDGSLPVDDYAHERPMEYERKAHEGTLNGVLVERRRGFWASAAAALWYTITVIALFGALGFGVFLVWVTLTWIGVL